jgi:hypothetical protein
MQSFDSLHLFIFAKPQDLLFRKKLTFLENLVALGFSFSATCEVLDKVILFILFINNLFLIKLKGKWFLKNRPKHFGNFAQK